MIDIFTRKVRLVLEDEMLRSRILFVLGALVVTRVLAAIPIPGINATELAAFLSNNQFLGLLNVFSGGGFCPSVWGRRISSIIPPRLSSIFPDAKSTPSNATENSCCCDFRR